MIGTLIPEQLVLMVMVGLGVWTATACALALPLRWLTSRLGHVQPRHRLRVLGIAAALPLCLAAIQVAVLFWPALSRGVVSAHCHAGLGCQPHAPLVGVMTVAYVATALLALALLACWSLRMLATAWRQYRLDARLRVAGTSRMRVGATACRVIEHPAPLAFTAGWLRPRVYLSRGLIDAVTSDELHAIVSHERSHAQRRDNLTLGLIRLLFCPVSARPAQTLLSAWRSACEELADAAAARAVGDALSVADTLIKAQRLCRTRPPAGASALMGCDLESRLHALLHPPTGGISTHVLVAGMAAGVLISAIGSSAGHHLVEHVTDRRGTPPPMWVDRD